MPRPRSPEANNTLRQRRGGLMPVILKRSPCWAAAIISDRSEAETLPPAGASVSGNDAGRVIRPASRRNHFPDDGFAKAARESVHVGSGVVGGCIYSL